MLVGCSVVPEPTDGETVTIELGQTFEYGPFEVELGLRPGFFTDGDLYAFYIPVTITNTSENDEEIFLWENTFYYASNHRFVGSVGGELEDDIAHLDIIEAGNVVEARIHVQYRGPGEYTIRFVVRDDASDFANMEDYNGMFEVFVVIRDND